MAKLATLEPVMKWVLVVVGVILALALIMYVFGSTRPKDHVATLTATIAASDSAVWAVVSNIEGISTWFEDVKSARRIADVDGRPAYRENYGNWEVTNVVRESVERRKLVREILPEGAFSGTWTIELAPEGAGTRVTITERGHMENPMFRAMMAMTDNQRTMKRYVEALRRKLG